MTDTSSTNKYYCRISVSSEVCTETPTFTSDTVKLKCSTGVVSLNFSSGAFDRFEVFPNPNNGMFEVRMGVGASAVVGLSLVNVLGQVVKVWDDRLVNGEAVEQISLPSTLADGVYFLVGKVDGGMDCRRLVVRR